MRLVGSVVEAGIHRASLVEGFSPLDLSPQAWYDASDTDTITDAGSGAVSQWDDKSGNAEHLTQGTGSNRPTTGTRTQNSLNVLDFTNDRLVNSSIAAVTQPYTVYLAYAHDSTGTQYVIDGTTSGGRAGLLISTTWQTFAGNLLNTGDSPNTNFNIWKLVFNGVSSEVYLNGTLIGSGNAGTQVPAGLVIGSDWSASFFFDGIFGEYVRLGGNITGADDTSMTDYLTGKWIP